MNSSLRRRAGLTSLAVVSLVSTAVSAGFDGSSAPTSLSTSTPVTQAVEIAGDAEVDTAPAADTPPATPDGVPPEHWPADVIPTLDWQPCDDVFECATATVPRDYDDCTGQRSTSR